MLTRIPTYLAAAALLFPTISGATDPYQAAREQLVELRVASAGVKNPRVLDAIRNTLRHEFIPPNQRDRAYLDMALPIGSSQTISSPFIVAMMTEALDPQPTDKVLEIGTGSGYQAAVLSPLVQKVYSIEIVPELGQAAALTLERLGYENVSTRVGDGFKGWPDAAPFDKIIVTCSPESVPQPLVDQLREGGMMIIPVGQRYQQTMYLMIKRDGELIRQPLRPTLFVPMTGTAEQAREVLPDGSTPLVVNGGFEMSARQIQDAVQGDNSSKTDSDNARETDQPEVVLDVGAAKMEDFVPGWYYGRQVRRLAISSEPASEGRAFARFHNETPGLSSHLLQGIAIDGRDVAMIRLGGKVRLRDVQRGPTPEASPMIAISLYDELRRDLGTFWIGPFQGTRDWRSSSKLIRIPLQTREAILRIGLFGATGTADYDAIEIKIVD